MVLIIIVTIVLLYVPLELMERKLLHFPLMLHFSCAGRSGGFASSPEEFVFLELASHLVC